MYVTLYSIALAADVSHVVVPRLCAIHGIPVHRVPWKTNPARSRAAVSAEDAPKLEAICREWHGRPRPFGGEHKRRMRGRMARGA